MNTVDRSAESMKPIIEVRARLLEQTLQFWAPILCLKFGFPELKRRSHKILLSPIVKVIFYATPLDFISIGNCPARRRQLVDALGGHAFMRP